MNVMKSNVFSKQKKPRNRNQKFMKSNLLGYHTVSSGLSLPFQNSHFEEESMSETTENVVEPSNSFSPANKSGFSFKESTSGETFRQCERSELWDVSDDEDEDEELPVNPRNVRSSSEDSPSLEKLLESFNSIREGSSLDNKLLNENERKRHATDSLSDTEEIPTKQLRVPSFRETDGDTPELEEFFKPKNDIAQQSFGHSTFNAKYSAHDFRSSTCTPTSRRTRQSRAPPTSGGRDATFSSTSVKSSSRTPSSKSPRSTPRTSGSGKVTSDSDAASYILAVTEGRGHARGEVGIAAVDPRRPHLILCQISDNQRYIHALTKMNVFSFVEVIIPNTFIEGSSVSKLYVDIRQHFPNITITSVQRRHFNEALGLELINQYCSPESKSIMIILKDKFYALSAASALIKYVQYAQNVIFAPRSVRVEYQGTEDTMIIDMDTANKLELVVSRINAESIANNTLLGVLKHCHTKGGVRLLRANILQPPCLLSKIETRLNCVTELIRKPLLLFALESAVSSFTNVESLLSLCMHEPQQDGVRAAEFQLKYVLLLKTTLELLPSLITSLEEGSSEYFREIRESLRDERFRTILHRILEVVPENAKATKSSLSTHLYACFSVKTGINGLLDVAKKTYCEIVQEIWDLVNSLREQYSMPLKMSFSACKGFHIQYTPEKHITVRLPKKFILVQKSKSTYYFYTSELVALDQRSQQVLNEVKLLTNVILFELLNDIRQHIGCLYNLCEYIAELDVIVAFAHVSSGQNYVRPQFGDVLNVVESRHPILDVIHEGKIVSNDIFAENGRNFVILTGPNQSGKSIYIGQIALLQIMAQIGCYVPAKEATFRMANRIFSKLGSDDSIENNASTLIAEIRDIEYIKQNVTANSLIIIDELCRGTSVEEGTSLAFTICEDFLDTSAFIFITTHYIFLTKLEDLYFNVTNYHFESQLVGTEGNLRLQFSHKRLPGVTKAEQYGLKVAEQTSFPSNVLATAKRIAQKLLLERKPLPEVEGLSKRYKISQELQKELSAFGQNTPASTIQSTILLYKTMLLKLRPVTDFYKEITEDEKNRSPTNFDKSMERVNLPSSQEPPNPLGCNSFSRAKENRTGVRIKLKRKMKGKQRHIIDISERIKKKYKKQMTRKYKGRMFNRFRESLSKGESGQFHSAEVIFNTKRYMFPSMPNSTVRTFLF